VASPSENKASATSPQTRRTDVVEILVNSATYGGGGIFGLYSTVAADSVWAPYIFVHEFAITSPDSPTSTNTSDVAYLPAADSRVGAVGANCDGAARIGALKWGGSRRRRASAIPSAWPKEEFERYTKEIQQKRPRRFARRIAPSRRWTALFRDEEKRDTALLNEGPPCRKGRGGSRGRNYERGLLIARRPTASCYPRQRAVLRRRARSARRSSRPLCKITSKRGAFQATVSPCQRPRRAEARSAKALDVASRLQRLSGLMHNGAGLQGLAVSDWKRTMKDDFDSGMGIRTTSWAAGAAESDLGESAATAPSEMESEGGRRGQPGSRAARGRANPRPGASKSAGARKRTGAAARKRAPPRPRKRAARKRPEEGRQEGRRQEGRRQEA